MTTDFDTWWNQDIQTPGNPHPPGQPAYWAWEGWKARDAEIMALRYRVHHMQCALEEIRSCTYLRTAAAVAYWGLHGHRPTQK